MSFCCVSLSEKVHTQKSHRPACIKPIIDIRSSSFSGIGPNINTGILHARHRHKICNREAVYSHCMRALTFAVGSLSTWSHLPFPVNDAIGSRSRGLLAGLCYRKVDRILSVLKRGSYGTASPTTSQPHLNNDSILEPFDYKHRNNWLIDQDHDEMKLLSIACWIAAMEVGVLGIPVAVVPSIRSSYHYLEQ